MDKELKMTTITPHEIASKTQDLAISFYRRLGGAPSQSQVAHEIWVYYSSDPRAVRAWAMAAEAVLKLTGDDPDQAVDFLER